MLKQARASGQLNLSGRGLVVIPDNVFTLCQAEEEERQRGSKTSGFSIDKVSTTVHSSIQDVANRLCCTHSDSRGLGRVVELRGLNQVDRGVQQNFDAAATDQAS